VLRKELAGTGVVHIGGAVEGHDPLFTRVLHLDRIEDRSMAAPAGPP
jgi:hypothetical protein